MRLLESLEEAKAIIQGRISSREWWIIPVCSPGSGELATAVEERFYSGDRNDKFVLVIIPRPSPEIFMLSVFMAWKPYMSFKELLSVSDRAYSPAAADEEPDAVFATDIPIVAIEWMSKEFDWS